LDNGAAKPGQPHPGPPSYMPAKPQNRAAVVVHRHWAGTASLASANDVTQSNRLRDGKNTCSAGWNERAAAPCAHRGALDEGVQTVWQSTLDLENDSR